MSYRTRTYAAAAAIVMSFASVPGAYRRNSHPRGRQRRRLRQCRPTRFGKRVRQHRRRGRPLRSAAGVLRPNAV